jgi:hypothetical protein
MMHGSNRDLAFALAAAPAVAAMAWLRQRIRAWVRIKQAGSWVWRAIQRRQLEEIAELRRDVVALLQVLDHWVTPGAGDKQRQFDYMTEVLAARGKRGISGADMRVARLIHDDGAFS